MSHCTSRQQHRFLLLRLCAVCLLCLSAGCTTLLSPGEPPVRMQLEPALPQVTGFKPIKKQVLISRPLSATALDNDAIILLFNDKEIRALAKTRWEATIPRMVQQCIMESLENTAVLQGVATEATGIAVDVRLFSDIRQFALRYPSEDGTPTAEFTAQFKIVEMNTGKVLDSLLVNTKVPSTGKDTLSLVKASEKALSEALAQLIPWILHVLEEKK